MTDTHEQVRDIVSRYGWNTTCYQVLNDGINHWLSADGQAMVGYVECGRHVLVAGAPICAEDRLPEVLAEWHRFTGRRGVCYVGSESRLTEMAAGSPEYSVVSLGSQPLWSAKSWLAAFRGHRSLREQRRRARAKGVIVMEMSEEEILECDELRACLAAWLARKPIPNMRFLVEPDVFRFWGDRRLFVARYRGAVVGFVVLCPIPRRQGWLTEDFIRHPLAPNGTIELALSEAIGSVGENDLVSMGICPLSLKATPAGCDPYWLRAMSAAGRVLGRAYYNFGGLEEFKAKFRPDCWEPVTVVCHRPTFTPSDLIAVVRAFTGYHPILMPWYAVRHRLGRHS